MSRASFALKESLYLRLEISNKYLMNKEKNAYRSGSIASTIQ